MSGDLDLGLLNAHSQASETLIGCSRPVISRQVQLVWMERGAICGAMAPAASLGMVHVCRRADLTGPRPRRPLMVSARQRLHTPAASREGVDDGLPRKPPYALPVPCIGTRKLAAPCTPDGFGSVAYACPMGIRLCLAQGG